MPVVKEALSRPDTMIQAIPDLVSARRKLVQAIPTLVICPASVPSEQEGGLRFCRELHAHPTYAEVPVILYAENLSEDSIRRAMQAGAKGILQIPFTAATLQHRVKGIVPALIASGDLPAPPYTRMPDTQTIDRRPVSPPGEAAAPDEFAEKMRLAQTLLAKVLHNLKTSDLLRLAEREDVPRVVYEMARSVCGVTSDAPAEKKPEESVLSGLESAFRRGN
jgi:CheY-like chemotaxis protein